MFVPKRWAYSLFPIFFSESIISETATLFQGREMADTDQHEQSEIHRLTFYMRHLP